jgi:hypothetical protein
MDIGLPQSDVPLALLTFNLGAEAGQLLFVAAMLVSFKILSTIVTPPPAPARLVGAYLIGTAAMFWLVDRLNNFIV